MESITKNINHFFSACFIGVSSSKPVKSLAELFNKVLDYYKYDISFGINDVDREKFKVILNQDVTNIPIETIGQCLKVEHKFSGGKFTPVYKAIFARFIEKILSEKPENLDVRLLRFALIQEAAVSGPSRENIKNLLKKARDVINYEEKNGVPLGSQTTTEMLCDLATLAAARGHLPKITTENEEEFPEFFGMIAEVMPGLAQLDYSKAIENPFNNNELETPLMIAAQKCNVDGLHLIVAESKVHGDISNFVSACQRALEHPDQIKAKIFIERLQALFIIHNPNLEDFSENQAFELLQMTPSSSTIAGSTTASRELRKIVSAAHEAAGQIEDKIKQKEQRKPRTEEEKAKIREEKRQAAIRNQHRRMEDSEDVGSNRKGIKQFDSIADIVEAEGAVIKHRIE